MALILFLFLWVMAAGEQEELKAVHLLRHTSVGI